MERERFYEGCHPPTVSSTSRNARVWADLLLSLARLARCEVRRPVIGRLLEQWPVTNHPPLYLEAIKYAWRFLSLSLSFSPRDTLLRVNLIRAAWDMTFRNREREREGRFGQQIEIYHPLRRYTLLHCRWTNGIFLTCSESLYTFRHAISYFRDIPEKIFPMI